MKEITISKALGWLVGLFVLVATLVTGLYYLACYLTDTQKTGSDIANIFVASATLLGPLVLVFTFSEWKKQHNKTVEADIAQSSLLVLSGIYSELVDITTKVMIHHYGVDGENEASIKAIQKKWSGQLKSMYPLIEHVLGNKTLAYKIINLENKLSNVNIAETSEKLFSQKSLLGQVHSIDQAVELAKDNLIDVIRELNIYFKAI